MADLSGYLGRVGEFFLSLAGLFLLLSMHPPFRRWLVRQPSQTGRTLAKIYKAADARSPALHRWSYAFRMIFRDKRGLLLIVVAVIGFDYFSDGYNYVVRKLIVAPYLESHLGEHSNTPTPITIYYYFRPMLDYIGYALFGWLALRHAQDVSFKSAARFSPVSRVLALFFCVVGINYFAGTLSPWLILHPALLAGPAALFRTLTYLFFGAALYFAASFILTRSYTTSHMAVAGTGFFGFVFLTQLIKWFHWASFLSQDGPYWAFRALRLVAHFTYTVFWDIAFIALIVVLAAPEEGRNPASVKPSPA